MICFIGNHSSLVPLFRSLRKAFFVLVPLLLFTLASPAFADGINYTVTSTDALTDLQFWFTFTLPSSVNSLHTFTTSTFIDSGDEFDSNLSTEVTFLPANKGGLLTIKVDDPLFQGEVFGFFGPQIYSGASAPFTLLTGTFPASGGFFVTPPFGTEQLVGGSVTATATSAPEPATLALLLLGSGILAISLLRRGRVPDPIRKKVTPSGRDLLRRARWYLLDARAHVTSS